MARSNVPKFGNWENEDNVPYTVYFEKARKNRGGTKIVNPNDPSENPEMFQDQVTPPANTGTKLDDPIARGGPIKPEHERRESRGDSDHGQPHKSPARGAPTEPNYSGGQGQRPPGQPTRPSMGSDHGLEQQRSPLHPQHQAKIVGMGSASPGWDGKSYDHSRGGGDHGRSRMRPTAATRGDESPDAGAAVPKFGEWDENDPNSAEQFTGIFEKVREERNAGPGNVSGTPRHPSNYRNQPPPKQPRCCFL